MLILHKVYKKSNMPLVYMSDIHFGCENCDIELLDNTIAWVKNHPEVRVILGGDAIDAISDHDSRWEWQVSADVMTLVLERLHNAVAGEIHDRTAIINAQCELLIEKLKPIASRIDFVQVGNHEDSVYRHDGVDASGMIAKGLRSGKHKPVVLSYEAAVSFVFEHGNETRRLNALLHHGWGGGGRPGGHVNKLENYLSQWEDIDMLVMGHVHKRIPEIPITRLRPVWGEGNKPGELQHKEIVMCLAGSFERKREGGHSGWAAKKGYNPASLGAVLIEFSPWSKNPDGRIQISRLNP